MALLTTTRELSQARATVGGHPICASLELAVASEAGGELAARFTAPRRRPRHLEAQSGASCAATAARLPAALRPSLAVESGRVAARLYGPQRQPEVLFARSYQMATCRGVVLGVRGRISGDAFTPPWSGTLGEQEAPPGLPLVLAPSAVLALVSYAVEATGGQLALASAGARPPLDVVDSAASPYPPHHHPFEGDGTPSAERPLLAGGRWCDRADAAGTRVDPLFYLLTRPERALRPLAAAIRFNRRNLRVACKRVVARPPRAVVIDSWRVRVGPRIGVVPFDAWVAVSRPDGARLALAAPCALALDPWQVLAQVRGASDASAPAIDEDPIEGDGYGRAPELLTDLTLADLRRA